MPINTNINTLQAKTLLYKLLKFGITGFIGLTIDFSITWLLKDYWGIDKYLANACGFAVAASCNFYINKKWTFEDKSKAIGKQYFSFLAIAIIGLALNTAFLYFFHQHLFIPFYFAKTLAIVIVFIWNFTANLLLTFNEKNNST